MTSKKACRGFLILLLLISPVWTKEDRTKQKISHDHDIFCKAIDALFTNRYPQQLEEYFCSLGTNPELGFRWAGTSAENAMGFRVAKEMREMGLSNVRREPVPVDVFEFKRASLRIGSMEMTCSAFAGVPSTPKEGITAPVVYVKGGTAVDFDAVGDVTGQIVLIDLLPDSWWLSVPVFEAAHRRAAGVVLTFSTEEPKYFSYHSEALGSFDICGDMSLPPCVYLCLKDGDWLKSQLACETTQATLILDQKVTLAKNGGVAYNVLGELPGSGDDGQLVILMAHQDAHFKGAVDSTAGVVNMLAIAKAMCASKARPHCTIVFVAICAEEFGHVNSYYDWLAGSWWMISHEHRDWVGKTRLMLNMDAMAGIIGTPVVMSGNPELKPWLRQLTSLHAGHFPFGSRLETPASDWSFSWGDQWTFTALGIPVLSFDTIGLTHHIGAYPPRYHSSFDTQDLIDWEYSAEIAKFIHVIIQDLDDGLLPYDLEEKAKDLVVTVKQEELLTAGGDPDVVSGLEDAVEQFVEDARSYQALCKSIPSTRVDSVNKQLLEIERILNDRLTALSAINDATIYPHQQVLADAKGFKSAISALQAQIPNTHLAIEALEKVDQTMLGKKFSDAVYQRLLQRKDPNYENLYWASEGKLPTPVNVISEYRAIQKGDIASAIPSLESKYKFRIQQLNKRLQDITNVLREAHTIFTRIRDEVEASSG